VWGVFFPYLSNVVYGPGVTQAGYYGIDHGQKVPVDA